MLDALSVSDLNDAKLRVVRLVQSLLHLLLNSPSMLQHSPFVDNQGIIRVGGRLSCMSASSDFKNTIILSKNSLFSILNIRHSYVLTGHGGKGFTLNHVPTVRILNSNWSLTYEIDPVQMCYLSSSLR